MSNETLISLAILKVNSEEKGTDYIDYIIPFILFSCSKSKIIIVTEELAQQILKDEYGLLIPIYVMKTIIKRLKKRGYIVQERNENHLVNDKIKIDDLENKKKTFTEKYDFLINEIIIYTKKNFKLDWNYDKTILIILDYLSSFSIEFLKNNGQTSAIPKGKKSKINELYIINSFVKYLKDKDDKMFYDLTDLVKGNMLANALLCKDLDKILKKYDNVVFYLDTPIILRLINLQGEYDYKCTCELIKILKKLNAELAIFEHTFREIFNVISYCEDNFDNSKSSSIKIIDELKKMGKTKEDLILIKTNLEKNLLSYKIKKLPTSDYAIPFQIDEQILSYILNEEINYWNPKALDYDIQSIRCIYSLRKNRTPLYLEDCVAILVTSNSLLSKSAFEYGKNHEATAEISSVITDFSLANISWLKIPIDFSDLPQLEMMAMCHTLLEPSNRLWEKYLLEIDELISNQTISSDDHAILRSSIKAKEELMNLTQGETESLNYNTISEMLRKIKEDGYNKSNSILSDLTDKNNKIKNRISKYSHYFAQATSYILIILFYLSLLLYSFTVIDFTRITTYYINNTHIYNFIIFNTVIGFIWAAYSMYTGVYLREFRIKIYNYLFLSINKALLKAIDYNE